MNFTPTFSPAPLSYMAALRGIKPRAAGSSFSYAVVNCTTPNLLMALAASNPEGQFYGFMSDVETCREAAHESAGASGGKCQLSAGNAGGNFEMVRKRRGQSSAT